MTVSASEMRFETSSFEHALASDRSRREEGARPKLLSSLEARSNREHSAMGTFDGDKNRHPLKPGYTVHERRTREGGDAMFALKFEVAEGGFLDIDVKLADPSGVVLYEAHRETSDSVAYESSIAGKYSACFSNAMSTITTKLVKFDLGVHDLPKKNEDEATQNKLENMLTKLSETLENIKLDQEYMQLRDRIHSVINESTNSRVVTWSVFEAGVVLLMTVGQVFYLKRFFEVRRAV